MISQVQGSSSVSAAGVRGRIPSQPVGSFVQARANQVLGQPSSFTESLGGNAAPAEASAARATYRRHGQVAHDLSDRGEVGRLISRSPQLDGLSSTRGDTTRCGGAAMLNAMLLDGDYRANSSALRQLAQSRHVQLTSSQQQALDAMQSGRLSPNQSAQLQELLYRVADTQDTRTTGGGLTGVELSATVGALTSLGGFPNTREANFRMTSMGGGAQHWTVTSTTTGGTAHADSWPGAHGYASVAGGPGATQFNPGGRLDPNFTADVTLTRGLDGTRLRTRAVDGQDVLENNFQLQPTARGLGGRRLAGDSGRPL